jgi:hypothetical protein
VQGDSVFARARNDTIHLHSDGTHPAQFFIDHGHDINGFTTFHVVKASGNTSDFSVAHSESRALLDNLQVSSNLLVPVHQTLKADQR